MNDAWNNFIKFYPFVKGLKCCSIEGESYRVCTEDEVKIRELYTLLPNSISV